LRNEDSFDRVFAQDALTADAELPRFPSEEEEPIAMETSATREIMAQPWKAVRRIACFFGLLIVLVFLMNAVITSGLRRIKTSAFGASNQVMEGKVNAHIVITGSSRATAHYDPRAIEAITGRTAFNLGRNGSQTDMQVALLKAYIAHNRKPEIVVHNLDAFTFETTREVYDPVAYTPYLYDRELYDALRKINPDIWKSRYVPLYGYVVEDMKFSWILGLRGFLGWSPPEDYFLGFNPRSKKWTDDFQQFKASRPNGVSFEIEPAGIQVVKDLIRVCRENQMQLILVYSPEYIEMQSLEKNRPEIFGKFHELADPFDVPIWDYSDWKYAGNQDFFQNSQHLNATGAAVFSGDLANRLKAYLSTQSKHTGDTRVSGPAGRSNARTRGHSSSLALRACENSIHTVSGQIFTEKS
jgi:hypothetical protein